jgi:hypothetical protein
MFPTWFPILFPTLAGAHQPGLRPVGAAPGGAGRGVGPLPPALGTRDPGAAHLSHHGDPPDVGEQVGERGVRACVQAPRQTRSGDSADGLGRAKASRGPGTALGGMGRTPTRSIGTGLGDERDA